MARHHMTSDGPVPFTEQEETERDAKEKLCADKQVELAKTQYQRDRATEYPPMADHLDGIVKGDQAQIDKYIADCLEIKQKHPKP